MALKILSEFRTKKECRYFEKISGKMNVFIVQIGNAKNNIYLNSYVPLQLINQR